VKDVHGVRPQTLVAAATSATVKAVATAPKAKKAA